MRPRSPPTSPSPLTRTPKPRPPRALSAIDAGSEDYKLASEDAAATERFAVTSAGRTELRAGASLKYELTKRYVVTVEVSDSGGPQQRAADVLRDSATVTIN
jgi:hypothetical protein